MPVIDSPPRHDVHSEPGIRPVSGREPVAPEPPTAPVPLTASPRTWPRRVATVGLAVLTAAHLLAALGYLFVITTIPARNDLQTGPRPAVVGPQSAAAPVAGPEVAPTAAVRATDLSIPKLQLREALVDLQLDAAGVLQPPTNPALAGWFAGAAAPGAVGPTVIVGHVDSKDGPGVFFTIKNLAAGDVVEVGRSDGRTARFRVTEVQAFDKTRFPTDRVYGPTAGPELRLITCGGAFDAATGHYERNVIAFGVLADPG